MDSDETEHLNEYQRQYRALLAASPRDRGRLFPGLLARSFEHAGFHARLNAAASRPRDADLFLAYDDEYLAEVKWTARKADVDVVDEVRVRLARTSPHLLGLIVSVSGFTRGALQAVETDRSRLILLMDAIDIEALFSGDDSIATRLRMKRRALVRDATALVGRNRPRRDPRRTGALGESAEHLLDAAGSPVEWFGIDGTSGRRVFVDEMPDIDWVPAQGHGVGLDVRLPVHSLDELETALETLTRLGWVTSLGRYSIQQPDFGWQGSGASGLRTALHQRAARYRQPRRRWHNEEQLTYFDAGPGWFYTLTSRVWIHTRRLVECRLSMQLTGVPVDPTRFRVLIEALGLEDRAYFRPLDASSRPRLVAVSRMAPLVVLGQIRAKSHGEDWVKGVLVEAQEISSGPDDDLVLSLRSARQWICRLRGWHLAATTGVTYRVSSIEESATDGAQIVSVTADWERSGETGRERRIRC